MAALVREARDPATALGAHSVGQRSDPAQIGNGGDGHFSAQAIQWDKVQAAFKRFSYVASYVGQPRRTHKIYNKING